MSANQKALDRMTERLLLLREDARELLARNTRDVIERAALTRLEGHLNDAILTLNVEDSCPVCGRLDDITTCRWCGCKACRDAICESTFHETPGRCPYAPEIPAGMYDGPEDPDIEWGKN